MNTIEVEQVNLVEQTTQPQVESTGSVKQVVSVEQTIQTEIETTGSVESVKQLKDQLQIEKNNNQINEILIKSLTNILTDRNNTINDKNNTLNSLISSNDNLLLKITYERIESERLLSQIISNINDLKENISKTSSLPLTEVIENIQEKDNSASIDNKSINKLYFNTRRYTRK